MATIYTVIVKNIANVKILLLYLEQMITYSLIDEIHLWDFTRGEDFSFLKNYQEYGRDLKVNENINCPFDTIINNKYKIIKINDKIYFYYKDLIINELLVDNDEKSNYFNIHNNKSSISIKFKKYKITTIKIQESNSIKVKFPNVKLFNSNNKDSYIEYYRYYYNYYHDNPDSINDIIIKSDDSIVFIDIPSFKAFINFSKKYHEFLYVFPNIINNEIIAYHQSRFNLIPFEMPYDTSIGLLKNNGSIANKLHKNFLENMQNFLEKSKRINEVIIHENGENISMNYFAILARNIKVFKDVSYKDTTDLAILITNMYKRKSAIYMKHVVSHLNFEEQLKTSFAETELRTNYENIAMNYKIK